jgi:hypothetical protein
MHPAHAVDHWYASGVVIGWTAVAVALLAVAVGLATWRLGLPRRVIMYSSEVTPLLAMADLPQRSAASLKVIYADAEIASPHLLKLRVVSRSRRDISSSEFDAGKPLVFGTGGTRVVGSVQMSGQAFETKAVWLGKWPVRITPALVRKGDLLRLDLITDGWPRVKCTDNPLLNVIVRRAAWSDPSPERVLKEAIAAAVIKLPGFGIFVEDFNPWFFTRRWPRK